LGAFVDTSKVKQVREQAFCALKKKVAQQSNALDLEINKNSNIHGILFKILLVVVMKTPQFLSRFA